MWLSRFIKPFRLLLYVDWQNLLIPKDAVSCKTDIFLKQDDSTPVHDAMHCRNPACARYDGQRAHTTSNSA